MRWAAFLRAINVGGHVVKMDRLRELFTELGFNNPQTYIASGNVIFEADGEDRLGMEQRIEMHLRSTLGYPVDTFLRSMDEMAVLAAYEPFRQDALGELTGNLYVAFLKGDLDAESRQRVLAYTSPVNRFHIHGWEVYWQCQVRSIDSGFSGAALEKAIRGPATMRNINTLRKVHAAYFA